MAVPVWLSKLYNYVWYEKVSKQYEPQKLMIYNIKWNQNIGAGIKKPADFMSIIDKLEDEKNDLYVGNLNYSDDDIVEYFMRDGLSAQGCHNAFMKLSGFLVSVDAGFDIGKIVNPLNKEFEAKTYSGKDAPSTAASVSGKASVGPVVKLGCGGKLGKSTGNFTLLMALPDEKMVTQSSGSDYFSKCFLDLEGMKISKAGSCSLQLGLEAKANFSALAKTSVQGGADGIVSGDLKAAVAFNGSCGVGFDAVNVSAKRSSDRYIFMTDTVKLFHREEGIRDAISKNLLRLLNPYDVGKHQKINYESESGETEMVMNPSNIRTVKMEIQKPYIEILTTDKSHNVAVGDVTGSINIGGSASGSQSSSLSVLGKKANQECSVNLEATLVDAEANAHLYKNAGRFKGRRTRVFIPFKPYKNQDKTFYYTQDTDILYCTEKSYSKYGYQFAMKKLCSGSAKASLKVDVPVKGDVVNKEKSKASTDYPLEIKGNIGGDGNNYEFVDNTLLYKSINTIWEMQSKSTHKVLKGTCFNIGKSIDLAKLTMFYNKFFDIVDSKYCSAGDLKKILKKDKLDIESCITNGERVGNAFKHYCSCENERDLMDKTVKSYKNFKESTKSKLLHARKSITVVDKEVRTYFASVEAFKRNNDSDPSRWTLDAMTEELNKRIVLLDSIIEKAGGWKKAKLKEVKEDVSKYNSHERALGVNTLIDAAMMTKSVIAGSRISDTAISDEYSYALELQKLLTLYSDILKVIEPLNISSNTAVDYLLPGDSPSLSSDTISLFFDLNQAQNIKAVIFESVFDVTGGFTSNYGNKLFYRAGGSIPNVDATLGDMQIPFEAYTEQCNDSNHKGIRVVYRMEDTYENLTQIFQLGTRMLGLDKKTGIDINLDLSYKNEQGAFSGILLTNLSKSDPDELNNYFRTVLIS